MLAWELRAVLCDGVVLPLSRGELHELGGVVWRQLHPLSRQHVSGGYGAEQRQRLRGVPSGEQQPPGQRVQPGMCGHGAECVSWRDVFVPWEGGLPGVSGGELPGGGGARGVVHGLSAGELQRGRGLCFQLVVCVVRPGDVQPAERGGGAGGVCGLPPRSVRPPLLRLVVVVVVGGLGIENRC